MARAIWPSNSNIASIYDERGVSSLDTVTGEERTIVPDRSVRFLQASVTPYGVRAVAHSPADDTGTKLLDPRNGLILTELQNSAIKQVRFSRSGRLFALFSSTDVSIFDSKLGELTQRLEIKDPVAPAQPFSKSDACFFYGSTDGQYIVINFALSAGAPSVLRGAHVNPAGDSEYYARAELSGDCSRLTEFSNDDHLGTTWNLSDSTAAHFPFQGFVREFISDGDLAITTDAGYSSSSISRGLPVRVWNTKTGRETFTIEGHLNGITSIRFSDKRRLLLTASSDTTAQLWQLGTELVRQAIVRAEAGIETAELSADDRYFFTLDQEGQTLIVSKGIALWDKMSGNVSLIADRDVRSFDFLRFGSDDTLYADGGVLKSWGHIDLTSLSSAELAAFARMTSFRALTQAEKKKYLLKDLFTYPSDQTDLTRPIKRSPMDCDVFAAHPGDPDKVGDGVLFEDILVDRALPACEEAAKQAPQDARQVYQFGRALLAAKRDKEAEEYFKTAIALGYPMASYNLAVLVADTNLAADTKGGTELNTEEARLLVNAIRGGVSVAAVRLLYQIGEGKKDQLNKILFMLDGSSRIPANPVMELVLGELEERGLFGARDLTAAARHFAIAAELYGDKDDMEQAKIAASRKANIANHLDPVEVIQAARQVDRAMLQLNAPPPAPN